VRQARSQLQIGAGLAAELQDFQFVVNDHAGRGIFFQKKSVRFVLHLLLAKDPSRRGLDAGDDQGRLEKSRQRRGRLCVLQR